MDAERDTDGTTDAYEGDHTPADGAGTDVFRQINLRVVTS